MTLWSCNAFNTGIRIMMLMAVSMVQLHLLAQDDQH